MNLDSFEHHWMRRAKWLTQALIISGTLNISLIATFVYFVIQGNIHSVSFELKPVTEPDMAIAASPLTNGSLLRAYSTLPFPELLLRLEDKEMVEEGYTKRDLALACLTGFHHFNLERALGGLVLQQRQITFPNLEGHELVDLMIFPGLADYQFQAIIHYAKTEKWPLTSQGLFYELKRAFPEQDPTLLEAFYLTPEFHALSTLFTRSDVNVKRETLVEMIAQGEWKMLQEFTEQQRQAQDLSPAKRRSMLLSYLNYRSKIAAKLLLETDFEYLCKRLDDAQVVLFFDFFSEKTPLLENFAKELLISPRSDSVWQKAASVLFSFSGEALPQPYDHRAVLARFAPSAASLTVSSAVSSEKKEEAVKAIAAAAPVKKRRCHTIQEGESLWKIARKYRVSIDDIKRINHLETDKLKVGRELELPEPKS